MWYVNPPPLEDVVTVTERFILTMWYVNVVGIPKLGFALAFYINYVVCKLSFVPFIIFYF